MATTNPTSKKPWPKWAKPFLEALVDHGTITAAARSVGVHRSTPYDLAERDADFAEAMRRANERATETLIAKAWERAVDHSDTLLMFLIKQRDPSFRETTRHEHSGRDGAPIWLQVLEGDQEGAG